MTKKYIPRFVTPGNIIEEYKKKVQMERRPSSLAPIRNVRLTTEDIVHAFLDKFADLGEAGWMFSGSAQHPDLPYGGVYVFYKEANADGSVEELSEFDVEEDEEQKEMDLDLTPDTYKEEKNELEATYTKEDEMESEMFVTGILGDEVDPETIQKNLMMAKVRDEQMAEEVKKKIEEEDKMFERKRHQQYKDFEEQTGKNAVWKGKETKQFKEWLADNV